MDNKTQQKTINLTNHRGSNSTTFTGRPEGEKARRDLNLDDIDEAASSIKVLIPKNTSSINPSFFLGLFYKTMKKMGMDSFRTKFQFEFLDDDAVIREILENNIEEGIVYAENFIYKKGGLFRFIR